jgi:hypothetical protein
MFETLPSAARFFGWKKELRGIEPVTSCVKCSFPCRLRDDQCVSCSSPSNFDELIILLVKMISKAGSCFLLTPSLVLVRPRNTFFEFPQPI